MQLLSLGFQYVITALVLLSKEPFGEAMSASELARPLNSPVSYLSQQLAKLIPFGIIGSRRGPRGGVYFTRDISEISLYEIIVAIEGDEFFQKCFLGHSGCGEKTPCPMHEQWSPRRDSIKQWLEITTLADLKNNITDEWISETIEFDPKM